MRPLVPVLGLILCLASVGQAQEKGKTPERYLRIGHYQCICRQGDFEANLNTVLQGLRLAVEARVQILSFPESFLTGYFRLREDAWQHSFAVDSPEIEKVLEKTRQFDILFMVGFNERRGDKLFNTVAVIDRGKILGTYSKAMPGGYFTPGREFPVFEKHGLVFGVIICADGGYIEPARILALKGARVIFAPHFNFVSDPLEHYQTVRSDHTARAVENGVYFVRGNNCVAERNLPGLGEDGHGYGESSVVNPNGQIVACAGLYDEYLMLYHLDLNKDYRVGGTRRSRESAVELLDILKKTLEESK
ncbi:MAG: carbon-nitrogen hydrolase family protein [Pirellulales bacterium]|nr:carbon-nitrogen hydrolase family protein [Pirellulales bacterium]